MRKELEEKWRRISHLQFAEFICDYPWQMLVWNNENKGQFQTRFPNQTQSWKQLQSEAKNDFSKVIPAMIRAYPSFLPLFLCVYPHRLTASTLMYLVNNLELKS